MGQDVEGFCAILRSAGHAVSTTALPAPPPRLTDLPRAATHQVMDLYRDLGGSGTSPALRPGSWDVSVDGVLVELDEELHFNRYRALTLGSELYERMLRFPAALYQEFCVKREPECLRVGRSKGRWMNASTESHFGPSAVRGDLTGSGSSRWKQRALYDFMKDLTQLDPKAPRMARVAIWDSVPGLPGVTVEEAVHQPPDASVAAGLRLLICDRAGCEI